MAIRRHGQRARREDRIRMNHSKNASRRLGRVGLGLLMVGLPACHGAGPWYRDRGDGSRNVVYRPVATSLRGRPFFVSGYGGADYSPAARRPIAPVGVVPANTMPDPALNPARVTVSQGTWDEP
jgi:hypothetical protein